MDENKILFKAKRTKQEKLLCCGRLFVDLQASVISSSGTFIPKSSGIVQTE